MNDPFNAYPEKSIARARSWEQRRSRRESLEHAGQIPLVFETSMASAEIAVVSNADPREDTTTDAMSAVFD